MRKSQFEKNSFGKLNLEEPPNILQIFDPQRVLPILIAHIFNRDRHQAVFDYGVILIIYALTTASYVSQS